MTPTRLTRTPLARSSARFAARLTVVVLVLAGASVAVSPGGALPAVVTDTLGSCAEAAGGMINVAIAVDPGVLPGAPRGPETLCVTVPEGSTGADVLVERARLLGRAPPRWAPSGLMCALDGYPATGCGERVDGSFRYWSYHLGDGGSWSFARTGPALRRASATRMEGWHFIAGANSPADPPPRVSASAATVCPPAPPVTTVPPAPQPSAPTLGPGDAAAAPMRDRVGTLDGQTDLSGTAGPDGSAGGRPGGGSAATGGSSGDAGSTGAGGPDSAADSDSGAGINADDDTGAAEASARGVSGDSDSEAMAPGRGPAMAMVRNSDPTADSGVPIAVVLMVVAVAAVGGGAAVRSRRRSHS